MRRRPAAAHRTPAGHGTKTVDLSLLLASAFADLAGAVFRRTLDPDGRDVLLAGAQLPHGTGLRAGELGTHADPGLLLERVSSDLSAGEPCSGTGQPHCVSRLLRSCVSGFRDSAPLGNLLPDRALLHFVPCPRIRLAGPARRKRTRECGHRIRWPGTIHDAEFRLWCDGRLPDTHHAPRGDPPDLQPCRHRPKPDRGGLEPGCFSSPNPRAGDRPGGQGRPHPWRRLCVHSFLRRFRQPVLSRGFETADPSPF